VVTTGNSPFGAMAHQWPLQLRVALGEHPLSIWAGDYSWTTPPAKSNSRSWMGHGISWFPDAEPSKTRYFKDLADSLVVRLQLGIFEVVTPVVLAQPPDHWEGR
jgi:hypothetical protein